MASQPCRTVIASVARGYSSPMIQVIGMVVLARMVAVAMEHLCVRGLNNECAEAQGDNQGSHRRSFVKRVHRFFFVSF